MDSLLNLGLSQQRAGEVAAARATYQQAVQAVHRQLKNERPILFKRQCCMPIWAGLMPV